MQSFLYELLGVSLILLDLRKASTGGRFPNTAARAVGFVKRGEAGAHPDFSRDGRDWLPRRLFLELRPLFEDIGGDFVADFLSVEIVEQVMNPAIDAA